MIETDASEGIADEVFEINDEFEGDPLAYETSEVNDRVEKTVSDCAVVEDEGMLLDSEMILEAASELAELASIPLAKLAATLTVEVA